MDEIWERAVEAALDGQTDHLATRTLTLDGAVKCVQGRLPPPSLLERFQNLHHLSIANIGVSSLEQFPRLRNLQRLILSDNRITVGLEFLVEAGLDSLRDLDLSNNRIQFVEDLAPLAELKLVSLDLYECPVTRVKDYRSRVFALIRTLKYLDKTDAEGNERPESDDEDDEEGEEDEEEEEEEGDEEDPGSGEVDGDERPEAPWMSNGHSERLDGVLDVDEDEESDAEDDESEQATGVNGTSYRPNGFRLQAVNGEEVGEDDGDDSESGEEIDEEEVGEDNDVVEVHEIEDSDNEEDGVDDEEDEEEDEDEEEVDNDDQRGLGVPGSTGRLMNAGEIDGHEQGDDDEDGDGETGEDDLGIEDDGEFGDEDDDGEEEDEESGEGYLVQPVSQVEDCDVVRSDIQPINEDNDPDEEEEEVEDDLHLPIRDQSLPSSSRPKRKRDSDDDDDDDDDDEDDDDDDEDGVDDEEG